MSPEQCQGNKLDNRSDIYSMGIVMYETLTNRLPLLGKTMVETMRKHIEEPPPPFAEIRPDLYIPERVEQVIMKALSKEPERRHQSMEQLCMDLESAIPRPGRSQVLRTAPLETEAQTQESSDALSALAVTFARMSLTQWGLVLGVIVALLSFTIVGMYMMWSLKTKQAQTTRSAPVQTVGGVAPAGGGTSAPGAAGGNDASANTGNAGANNGSPAANSASAAAGTSAGPAGATASSPANNASATASSGTSSKPVAGQLPAGAGSNGIAPGGSHRVRQERRKAQAASAARHPKKAVAQVSQPSTPTQKKDIRDLLKQRSY
jgi:serine/threonine-protein kinase